VSSKLTVRSGSLVTLAIIWLICLLGHGGNLDRDLFSQIHDHGTKLIPIADGISTLGSPLFLCVVLTVGAALLLWLQRIRATVVFIALVFSCRILRLMQEMTFALPRPNASVAHVAGISPYGFPSGHAANSMATYLGLALIISARGPWRDLALVLALATTFAVGISRVFLGVHWPSDVMAGWSFGCFWTVSVLWADGAAWRSQLGFRSDKAPARFRDSSDY